MEKKNQAIIAFAGKGGVGKTSLAATTVRLLKEAYPDKKILAIDADPAVGLSTALGIEVKTTIDDIRKEIVAFAEAGEGARAVELMGESRYRIFDALEEPEGYSFLAIGRPEAAGCYCKINGYLKEVIRLLADQFDYVVIDGEAGIEQINRRVMEKVTHLMLVTDTSKKGCQVIKTIRDVADELVMYERCGAIVNRLPDALTLQMAEEVIDTGDIEILSYIPSDASLTQFDLKGENVFYMPADAQVVCGMKRALGAIGILKG